MVATLIRIPDEHYRLYKEIAFDKGISLSEFIRKALEEKMKLVIKTRTIMDVGTKFIINNGPKDGSTNHDAYYYKSEAKKLRQ